MPQSGKRKLIEERLGEDLEGFIEKRIASGEMIKSIAQKLGVDPGLIRYYRDKRRRKRQPILSSIRKTRPRRVRLKGGHVDICLCPSCQNECREREKSHGEGRCVIICSDFRGRLTEGVRNATQENDQSRDLARPQVR